MFYYLTLLSSTRRVIMLSEKQPLTSCGEVHLLLCCGHIERAGGGIVRVDLYFAPLVREDNEVTAGVMKGNL